MKVCKLLHINDGRPREIANGEFLFAEEYVRTSDIVNEHLADGWEVKNMVTEYIPGGKEERYPFYCQGFTFYLEREE